MQSLNRREPHAEYAKKTNAEYLDRFNRVSSFFALMTQKAAVLRYQSACAAHKIQFKEAKLHTRAE